MALLSMEDVAEALGFVEQLAAHPDSHYRAALLGGPQFIGWGHDQQLAADTRDVLYVITAALGGEKITAEDLYARPERAPEVDAPVTVADFDVAAFMRRLAGA